MHPVFPLSDRFRHGLAALAVIDFSGEELAPIRGLPSPGFWERHGLWVGAGLLVLLGLLAFVLTRLRRRPAVLPPSPLEQARAGLAAVEPLLDGTDDRAFSSGVSDTLRRYLEDRYEIRAPGQTTGEFLESARSGGRLPESLLASLGRFLELCDLAKFARHAFGSDQRRELLAAATGFLEEAEGIKNLDTKV